MQDFKQIMQSTVPGLDKNAGEKITKISQQLHASGKDKELIKVVLYVNDDK